MLRVIYTLLHLRLEQFYFLLIRRLIKPVVREVHGQVAVNENFKLDAPIQQPIKHDQSYTFDFIGEKCVFESGNIDWESLGKSMLWRFNQHYFDYLRNPLRDSAEKAEIIASWISQCGVNNKIAWDPFTASLRVVNWIFHASDNCDVLSPGFVKSLYKQSLFIEKNDERELLANHYFENLKALFFAGVFFEGADAQRWRERAVKEIVRQLSEQTLSDGGHYERSPQYHCLMLENYLDIYNLVSCNAYLFDVAFRSRIQVAAEQGLRWLEEIVFPDGQIPLLNDSAFGVAPTLKQLSSYAQRLFDFDSTQAPASMLLDKPESGLYGIKANNDMLIMDCGDIGPAYQPGHTHCDFLSYELMVNGQRIVVDTGVSEYAPGAQRHYLRSTAAHNTVSINGLEQSEIWGEFRVARRAKKLEAAIIKQGENISMSGAYAGFYDVALGLKPGYRHARKINVKLVKERIRSVAVVDTLFANRDRPEAVSASNYIHLHPDVKPVLAEDKSVMLFVDGECRAKLIVESLGSKTIKVELADSIYCPNFGVTIKNKCIRLDLSDALPIKMGYRFEFSEQ